MPRRSERKRNIKISKDKKVIIVASSIIASFIIFFSVIFSIINMANTKIIIGIRIEGIDISNNTKEEATEKINKWYKEEVLSDITAIYNETKETINIEQIEVNINVEKEIQKAYQIGRSGNIIKDNYDILLSMIFQRNIKIEMDLNEEKLNKSIEEISKKLPNSIQQSNYYIEEENMIITKGKKGIQIREKFKDDIKKSIISKNKEIRIETEEIEPQKIDIKKIHEEIYKEAKNASVIQDPIEVKPHVNGIDFGISIEEINKLLEEEKEEYIIPLKITIPEITLDKLSLEAFPNKLSEYSTRYDASNKNRTTNLELASDKINGTIILPGETFSYNKVVGERTIAKGYKEATVYSGGKVVEGIGGGICQLSSTLYNAAIYANVEITSRSNHRFTTSYVPTGRDATVSWGTIDLCFKNTRKYPIKIVSTVKNGIAKIEIMGIKEEKEYEIVIESTVLETIPYTTNYIKDTNLKQGEEQISQYGIEGAKSITYKIIKYNGSIISKTVLSKDTYSTLEQIVKTNTNKIESNNQNNNEMNNITGLNPDLIPEEYKNKIN